MHRKISGIRGIGRYLASAFITGSVFLLFSQFSLAAVVPQAASAIGRELDRQIVERLGMGDSPAQGVSLCITTPVDSTNLETSNTLARQMQEEVARWFVQAGYNVQEIRKGADLLFEPATGEMLLTRKESMLGSTVVGSAAIIAGTYTVTPRNVRFNIRMLRVSNREVIAMSTMTVPINGEVAALLRGGVGGMYGGLPIEPTVVTLLP
ncbi:MAG: hypothetical protein LBD42_08455 [Desulfovibrio sp.]|jgi:hypothetical protein|nr:hypothetical protein [Desulfovibrio sp.]